MNGDKRNFSLSIWDHEDNFLCLLKSASGNIEGQSYNENIVSNIYGEETLTFTIPAYINERKENEKWNYIFNEQKIRYIEYDDITNLPIEGKTKEFVLKHYDENRNGYEKTVQCECQSLAIYELSKTGWNINFDINYISKYEQLNPSDDYLTLDFWLKKIFYKETNLGRVSTTTEYTYLQEGLQLRDDEGYPISSSYSVDENGNYYFERIEPNYENNEIPQNYLNTIGWSWEIQVIDPRRLDKQIIIDKIYEKPVINRYIEVTPNNYLPYSYQCEIEQEDSEKTLKPYPIEEKDYSLLRYVTDVKRSLVTCERSNIFSIIQELCEIFQVWAHFYYEYNTQGKIIGRKILFKSTAINDNIIFDFSYGKNLQSCTRSIDSNDLVTKLIIPDTDSSLDSNKVLSIKQASANQTGEGYIYNFDYFYNIGSLTRLTEEEKNGNTSITNHSDEYKINYHCGKLKELNTKITNIQNYLVPLYNRQLSLSTDLTVQEASIIGIKQSMSDINDKISAIPEEEQIVQSWSSFTTQANYIGQLKTITGITTYLGSSNYLSFGREDVLYYTDIQIQSYRLDNNGDLIEGELSNTIESYAPRYYNKSSWDQKSEVSDNDFISLTTNDSFGFPEYSEISGQRPGFIKGFYFNDAYQLEHNWVRIRYKYAPLAYYYMLLKDYWDKLLAEKEKAKIIGDNLQEINNKIINNEMILKNLLAEKNELILQFEKEYNIYIKEGYWEPSEYQSQINSETVNTSSPKNIYEGFVFVTNNLSDLNLNESLHNYTYYIPLGIAANALDIDSIEMITYTPIETLEHIPVARNRGSDFEIYIDINNQVIIGIAPSLIDTYKLHNYEEKYYKSRITYTNLQGDKINVTYNGSLEVPWVNFTFENSPKVIERYIYLSNDNILTYSLEIYGDSAVEENKLTYGTDYIYTFDYAGYVNGHRIELDNQTSYNEDIVYDYITKITLKNSNKVNSFGNGPYIVKYSNETTLQFLYNDALATSEKYCTPQITYSISILDISSLNEYKNYRPILGQKVPIYDTEMRLNGYEGVITSISKELERPENTQIELATYQTKFEDIFQKLTVTMTDVRYNQSDILNAANSFSIENGTIKAEVFQKSLEENDYLITLGANNDITIDKESGITLVDRDNNKAVKIIGNGIFLTDDYSNKSQWKTGITGDGINASALKIGNIDTKNISIWNASEGQIRFMWNEQGLFAYGEKGIVGTSTDTVQDFVDYNKFVKFSYDGLQFQDNEDGIIRSALSLGWDGLKISAQNNSLELNATQGLIIKDWDNGLGTTRLELGRLDEGNIYGLRLRDTDGNPSFQSDSDGNLWLSKYIKIGGQYNAEEGNYSVRPNAGIVGATTTSIEYEMGLIKNSDGIPIWSNKKIRFWAGPQTKSNYLSFLNISNNDISDNNVRQIWNNLEDNTPTTSRFKVDEDGNIIASGIDVGGWTGSGSILASKNYEAILRSNGYEYINTDNKGYPVLAIGQSNPQQLDKVGTSANLRIYKDGSINVGNGRFIVEADGHVVANDIEINGNEQNITEGTIGGLTIHDYGLEVTKTVDNVNYRTGVYSQNPNNSLSTLGNLVFLAGPDGAPTFYVTDTGVITATNINIGGASSNITGGNIAGWNITEESLYKKTVQTIDNTEHNLITGLYANRNNDLSNVPVLYIGEEDHEEDDLYSSENSTLTKFKIAQDGSVYFHGGIWGWSEETNSFRRGLNSGRTTFYTSSSGTMTVEVCQGLIVDIS